MPSFFGKYRGKVVNNLDPLQLGRMQVSVPAVLGEGRIIWALPCVPYAGPDVGLFILPPVGANIWVEFEGGDPDFPVWTGCFWASGEMPVKPALPGVAILKTKSTRIQVDDTGAFGGLIIEVGSPVSQMPLKIVFDQQGIRLVGGVTTLDLGPNGSSLQVGGSSLKQQLAGTELKCGAAKVNLSPSTVSINDGALEVI